MNVLTECLAQGTSPVGVVSFAKEYLKQQGFEELYYNKMISPKENSKYIGGKNIISAVMPLQQVLEKK